MDVQGTLRCLKVTPRKRLLFKKTIVFLLKNTQMQIREVSTKDWRLTLSFCTLFGGNLATMRKKWSILARSSVKAKFENWAWGMCEVMWIKIPLEELNMEPKDPMKIYSDDKAIISIAQNPLYYDWLNMMRWIGIS